MTPDIPREEIEALLVFLANDTLEGEERAMVEAAVAADPVLQTELATLKAVQADMLDDSAGTSPGEFGLARLMRDIDAEPMQTAPEADVVRPRVWQWAAAAAVALFAAQTAWIFTSPDSLIELAGGGSGGVVGPKITVAFSEDATEGAIRSLLQAQGLIIVDGPSALGLYTLVADDDAARDAALRALRGAGSLVESAEAEE
jgi:hypothetical protein